MEKWFAKRILGPGVTDCGLGGDRETKDGTENSAVGISMNVGLFTAVLGMTRSISVLKLGAMEVPGEND